jgi:hypothetical protein
MRRAFQRGAIVVGIASALAMAGCATRETIMMYNPQTREIARCAEGYRSFMAGTGYRSQEDCIEDYQRRGYERMSAPGAPTGTR